MHSLLLGCAKLAVEGWSTQLFDTMRLGVGSSQSFWSMDHLPINI